MLIDNSNAFIYMLSKAKEIQQRKEVTLGNFYFDSQLNILKIIGIGGISGLTGFDGNLRNNLGRYIWIPTLGQLFNIFISETRKREGNNISVTTARLFALELLHTVTMQTLVKSGTFTDTLDKLLLITFYAEFYEKVWDGNDWVELKSKNEIG